MRRLAFLLCVVSAVAGGTAVLLSGPTAPARAAAPAPLGATSRPQLSRRHALNIPGQVCDAAAGRCSLVPCAVYATAAPATAEFLRSTSAIVRRSATAATVTAGPLRQLRAALFAQPSPGVLRGPLPGAAQRPRALRDSRGNCTTHPGTPPRALRVSTG